MDYDKKKEFKVNINYDLLDEEDNKDIYSSSFTDIYSSSPVKSHSSIQQNTSKTNAKRKKRRKKKPIVKILSALICILLVVGIAFYAYAYNILSKMERTELDSEDLGISTSNYDGVKNIALFGIDSRQDNSSGRSDANVILTIDKKHKKIKLTSIARDTYVAIDGHSNQKLTHAYAYGKSQLAVKTLNKNFGLEITDYVTMNFFELARVIDYIGGVYIDVSDAEFKELNSYVIPTTDFGDIKCELLPSSGYQKLSGAQAVCFARIRHTDGDIERGNRQKEVLTAMFTQVKTMNVLKLPEVAEMVVSECQTSLSTNDIIGLGTWALTATPEFEQLSIPNDNVPGKGKIIGGAWCYVYDLEKASKEIKDFIFEENYYSKEEVAKRLAEETANTK